MAALPFPARTVSGVEVPLLNILWSGGRAYSSIQKVHESVIEALGVAPVHTWYLNSDSGVAIKSVAETRNWEFSKSVLKGKPLALPFRYFAKRQLAAELRSISPSVVLLDGMGVARFVLPILAGNPTPRILLIIHGKTRIKRGDVDVLKDFSRSQLSVVAVSDELSRALRESLSGWCGRIHGIRTALHPGKFAAGLIGRELACERLGLNPEARYLAGVGRLAEVKGWGTLISAFSRVTAEFPDWRLVLIGEGEERGALERQISDLGLEAKVTLLGHRADVAALYRAFDWVAMPSRHEGLGLVVQEALLSGVPVMVSDIPVFHEQLGEAGLYADPGDTRSWAHLLARGLAESAEHRALRQNAELAGRGGWELFCSKYRELMADVG